MLAEKKTISGSQYILEMQNKRRKVNKRRFHDYFMHNIRFTRIPVSALLGIPPLGTFRIQSSRAAPPRLRMRGIKIIAAEIESVLHVNSMAERG